METEEILKYVLLFGSFAGVLGFAVWGIYNAYRFDELEDEERAFDELIQIPPDPTQLARLKPLVHQVGLLRVAHDDRRQRTDLVALALPGTQYDYVGDEYEIWVSDSLGAIHDVYTTRDPEEAARVTRHLVMQLDAELQDPERIVV